MANTPCRRNFTQVVGRFIDWINGRRKFEFSQPSPGGCVSGFVGRQQARFIGWTGDAHGSPGTGLRIFAYNGECCGGNKTPLHRTDCLAGGISDQGVLHSESSITGGYCYDAGCDGLGTTPSILQYNAGSGTWKGSLVLRGGTMNVEINCDSTLGTIFELKITGCDTVPAMGWQPAAGYSACADTNEPITASWNLGGLYGCCDDPGASAIGISPNIVLWAVFNCNHQRRMARWIGWTGDAHGSPGTGKRIFALAESCNHPNDCCLASTCDVLGGNLIASLTSVSGDCGSYAGTYTLNIVSVGPGTWNVNSGFPLAATLGAVCTADKGIRVTMTTTNGGGAITLYPPAGLLSWENLDVQGDMSVTNAGGDPPNCTGVLHVHLTRAP